jgi:tRNA threonylcarbamoyladenosine biosynthesis protein TsaB
MWLAIDTATSRASVALGDSTATAVEEELEGSRRHAGALIPMIQALLRRRGATMADLSGIALSDGPGSFTGLRVGASVAKALVHAQGVPLWIAPSLMVRAKGVGEERSTVLAVADALRGEVYAAVYRTTPGGIECLLVPSVWRPEALAAAGLETDILVGDVPPEVAAPLERWVGRSMVRPPEGAPHARQLIDLVGRPGGAVAVTAVRDWEPVYGRPAEAQARWEMAHGRALPDPIGQPR